MSPVRFAHLPQSLGRPLRRALRESLSGEWESALSRLASVAERAEELGMTEVQAEALRQMGTIWWRRGEIQVARDLLERSRVLAQKAGDRLGTVQACNQLGILSFTGGRPEEAEALYRQALAGAVEAGAEKLQADIYNNLGALANLRGDWEEAAACYEKALAGYAARRDHRGLARTYNNLGLTYRDRSDWARARESYENAIARAQRAGDIPLVADCSLNLVQSLIECGDLARAREVCDEAFETLVRLDDKAGMAEAAILYGIIYRRKGRGVIAERHLLEGISLNERYGNPLGTAEGYRELGLLYREGEKNRKALECLGKALALFREIQARQYQRDIGQQMADLEELYLHVAEEIGQEVESTDTYTFGHSRRVAHYAVELASRLGLPPEDRKGILVAAFLHDLGKVKIDKGILTKPRHLTPEEYLAMKMHPVHGVRMLDSVEFPWEVKSHILHHQERWDGKGYPQGLRGEEIPLGARIIALADFFDALTTDRPYRRATPLASALEVLERAAGTVVDPFLCRQFVALIREHLPEDHAASLSAIPFEELLRLWGLPPTEVTPEPLSASVPTVPFLRRLAS